MITSRQLQAFIALIDHGSLTRAADVLDIAQPTASKLIRNLEREVGMALFLPDRQRLVPTPEALILAERARRAVEDMRSLGEIANELRHLRSGRLELIAVGALGNHAVVDLLAQMVREIPALAVSLSVTVERDVPGWLANSRADWALCMMPVDRPDIHCEPLVRFEACCVMATTHRLALQSVVCPEDLEGESFISFRSDGRLRQTIDGLFVSRGVQRRLQFEVYGSEQACALAAKGVGVALVEPLSASRHVALGHVAMRRFEPAIVYTVYLLRHRQRPISRVASRFAELLRQQLPGLLTDRGAHLLDG